MDNKCHFNKDGMIVECLAMGAMLDSCSMAGIGADKSTIVNFTTGKQRYIITYTFTKKAIENKPEFAGRRKMQMGVCPFCQASLVPKIKEVKE